MSATLRITAVDLARVTPRPSYPPIPQRARPVSAAPVPATGRSSLTTPLAILFGIVVMLAISCAVTKSTPSIGAAPAQFAENYTAGQIQSNTTLISGIAKTELPPHADATGKALAAVIVKSRRLGDYSGDSVAGTDRRNEKAD